MFHQPKTSLKFNLIQPLAVRAASIRFQNKIHHNNLQNEITDINNTNIQAGMHCKLVLKSITVEY